MIDIVELARRDAAALRARDAIRNGSEDASELRQSPEFRAAQSLDDAADEIERLRNQRDAYLRGVGQIYSSIPLPDVVRATGSLGDLVAYLKENLPNLKGVQND